jgi:hypothetical protein
MIGRLTLLLSLVAAVSACSTETAGSSAAAPPPVAGAMAGSSAAAGAASGPAAAVSACDLLTPDQISAVLGRTIVAPEPGGYECAFRYRNEHGLLARAVRLRLEEGADSPYDLYERYTAAIRQALGEDYAPETVLGLGSVAGWDGDAVMAAEGIVPGRSFVLVVQLDGAAPDTEQAQAEALAQAALGRLRALVR